MDHTVYRRTTKGQAAAMPGASTVLMHEEQRRLLLLVNGYTSLGVLARFGRFADGPEKTALALQTCGLIEEAQGQRPEFFMKSPWREPPNS